MMVGVVVDIEFGCLSDCQLALGYYDFEHSMETKHWDELHQFLRELVMSLGMNVRKDYLDDYVERSSLCHL